MPDLRAFGLTDMVAVSAALRRAGAGAQSMEEAAQAVVHHLYDGLRSPNGDRQCVLARFYRTVPLEALDDDLRRLAEEGSGGDGLTPTTRCLTLLATAGEEPAWNDRRQSTGHRVTPLASEEIIASFPMVAQLIRQFGLATSDLLETRPDLAMTLDEKTFNVFYVPNAVGSPHIPAQDDFVLPYGVQSVLGFGGMLPTGDLFAIVLFSRAPVPVDTADLFAPLALSVKVAVLPFTGGRIFRPAGPPAPHAVAPGRSGGQTSAIEQLLEVHERTAAEQAFRLEEAHRLEHRRSHQLQALAAASVVIGSTLSMDEILSHVTEQARSIVGAHMAVVSLTADQGWAQSINTVSLSDRYAEYRDYDAQPDGSGIYALVCETNRPVRLTQEELLAHPRWRGFGAEAHRHPPLRGWLAVPLIARNGDNLGLLQLSDAVEGAFTAADEAILVQLAHLASVSVENARAYAREHAVAAVLQESLLPQELPRVDGIEVAARYLPGTAGVDVGGDWYDVLSVSATEVALVIGDVVGHDIQAATTMARLRHAMQAFASEDPSPASVFGRLNRFVARPDDDTFATAIYLLLDTATGTVQAVNAGHPPPLLVEGGRARYLPTVTSPPIGLAGCGPFAVTELTFPVEATLLLYTDGLVERRGEGLDMGLERLRRLGEAPWANTAGLLDHLLAALRGSERPDDIALLAIRRPAPGEYT